MRFLCSAPEGAYDNSRSQSDPTFPVKRGRGTVGGGKQAKKKEPHLSPQTVDEVQLSCNQNSSTVSFLITVLFGYLPMISMAVFMWGWVMWIF